MARDKFTTTILYKSSILCNHKEEAWLEEEYKSWIEDCCDGEATMTYDEWVEHNDTLDWDNLFDNLKYSEYECYDYVINGTLGLWNGTPMIEPVRITHLSNAIKKCCNKADAVEIILTEGCIKVNAHHHDGTNHFQINMLNLRGEKVEDHSKLAKPYYWKLIRGC